MFFFKRCRDARITELSNMLEKYMREKSRLQSELDKQQSYTSLRAAVLTAFNEMQKSGATELVVKSMYKEVYEIHIKREVTK